MIESLISRKRRVLIEEMMLLAMRCLLVQAAWAARRSRGKHPMVDWSLEVEKRRGKRIAIVAFARKLAGILFALWRDGTLYSSREAARPMAPTMAA